jgi:hypothetical protein
LAGSSVFDPADIDKAVINESEKPFSIEQQHNPVSKESKGI